MEDGAEHGEKLSHAPTRRALQARRRRHRLRRGSRRSVERRRIRVQPQRRERLVERAPAEQRRGCGPERSIAIALLRAQLAAERDELRQVGDGVDLVCGRDADEAVRVEVVAEEQRAVVVGRRRRGASRP